MVLAQPSATIAGGRSLEEILTDLQTLARELIGVASPTALDGAAVGGAAGIGVRLTAASPLLRAVCSQLDILRMTWLPRIEADGMWALDGSRTFRTWLARREKVTMRTVSREMLTGERLLEHLPSTLAAALTGRLGMDQVRAMVDVGPTSDDRRKALVTPVDTGPASVVAGGGTETGTMRGDGTRSEPDAPERPGVDDPGEADSATDGTGDPERAAQSPTGEELLLDLADQHGPLVFRRFVDRFARVADPESDERGYRQATEREHLDVAKTFGGYHVNGFLTDEHGEALRAAMDSVMGAPTPGDERTPAQRRAQALADLARTVLDNGLSGTGAAVRPHVTVTVSWTELARLTSQFSGKVFTPDAHTVKKPTGLTDVTAAPARFGISASLVPTTTLRRLLCDSAVTRVVFGADSQVLDVGRAQRTVTGQMRRAVIARDRHCVYVDCTQPPARCEVHHAERHWADGGDTSARNAALLCWHHHDLVDTTGITMRWTGNPDGVRHSGWTLVDRHGQEIHPAGSPPRAIGERR